MEEARGTGGWVGCVEAWRLTQVAGGGVGAREGPMGGAEEAGQVDQWRHHFLSPLEAPAGSPLLGSSVRALGQNVSARGWLLPAFSHLC